MDNLRLYKVKSAICGTCSVLMSTRSTAVTSVRGFRPSVSRMPGYLEWCLPTPSMMGVIAFLVLALLLVDAPHAVADAAASRHEPARHEPGSCPPGFKTHSPGFWCVTASAMAAAGARYYSRHASLCGLPCLRLTLPGPCRQEQRVSGPSWAPSVGRQCQRNCAALRTQVPVLARQRAVRCVRIEYTRWKPLLGGVLHLSGHAAAAVHVTALPSNLEGYDMHRRRLQAATASATATAEGQDLRPYLPPPVQLLGLRSVHYR
eukprot:SAG31_NODE_1289_length_8983_cov_9.783543_6_plen_261_part_00